jgi:hypothetical protein
VLLTDHDCLVFDDLVSIDPDIADIAATETIPTEGDNSFIHYAVMEAGNRIMALMGNFGYPYTTGGVSYTNQTGMFMPWADSTPAPRLRLGQIVVDSDTSTFDSPLKTWIKYLALRTFYQVASDRNLGDRYDKKRVTIERDIDRIHWPNVKATGIPMVRTPISGPGSYEVNAGIWSSSNVSTVAASGTAGGTFDVVVTWYSPSLACESAPSSTMTVSVSAANALQVSIATLNPPNFILQQNIQQATGAGVTAWIIYAGLTGQSMYYQMQLPIATTSYTFLADPVLSGKMVGTGQQKDADLVILNLYSRC